MKKNKIYHGPSTVGGIGGYISKYLRSKGYISDCIVYDNMSVRDNFDYNLRLSDYSKVTNYFIRIINFFLMLIKYDIFHFYAGMSLLPYNLDLPILKLFRKKIIMTYCGSESRLIEYVESKRNPYAHLLRMGINHPKYDSKKVKMLQWHGLWCDKVLAPRDAYRNVLFVIKKEKVLAHPWIHNLGFDITNLCKEVKSNDIPIIVHAPTNKEIKGTIYVEKAINNLKSKGLKFKYQRVENMPNKTAQEIYKNSDIIVDQFLISSFGTLAVEGMGYGKPVVQYIVEEVKNEHFPDCPIYNANIENLEERLELLILDKSLRIELGIKGVDFVKKYFDNKVILENMEKVYKELY